MRGRWLTSLVLFALLGQQSGGPLQAIEQTGTHQVDDMVLIPAGPFVMGGDFDEERPRHRVVLEAFRLDRHEATNAQYAEFLRATMAPEPRYWNKNVRFHSGEKFPQHPFVGISWRF
mgnify:FL=1